MSFIALFVSLPTKASTGRMRVWRSVKALGCATLRDGVYLLPDSADSAAALDEVAAQQRAKPAQIALAWVLRQPGVVAIPKSADPAHLRHNAGAAEIVLEEAEDGVSPGQACVFYETEGSRILGGGWIWKG